MSQTGAARLASKAALRAGAGLVTVACSEAALPIYAASSEAVMTRVIDNLFGLDELLADARKNAFLIGPGCGVTDMVRKQALAIVEAGKLAVLDADALTVFADMPNTLFFQIHAPCIITPHEGEFARLFAKTALDTAQDKASRALEAAKISGAVVVLKGFETIIADPDGRVVANISDAADLATAGSGDVLSGLCLGLLAQGMPAFDAACAAVWIHSEAARRFGPGLISEDLHNMIPQVLRHLKRQTQGEHVTDR